MLNGVDPFETFVADDSDVVECVGGAEAFRREDSDDCGTEQPVSALAPIEDSTLGSFWSDLYWGLRILSNPPAIGITQAEAIVGRARGASQASSTGDPFFRTFDGLSYWMESVGEFTVMSSPSAGIDVQARYVATGAQTSGFDTFAAQVGDHRVQIRPIDGTYLIDGNPVALSPDNFSDLGNGGLVARTRSDQWMVTWPSANADDQPFAIIEPAVLSIHAPDGMGTTGLYGNNNNDPADDLSFSDGSPVGIDPSPATLDGLFADSWRITDDESLFAYPAGLSTADFTDNGFPQGGRLTMDSFPEADRAAALGSCAWRLDGPAPSGPAQRACALDRLTTGDYNSWHHQYAQPPLLTLGDIAPNATGSLQVTFDGGEGDNVAPTLSGSTTDGDGFAGPYSTYDYSYAGYAVGPPHDSYQLSFDLLAIGDWTATANPNQVGVSAGAYNWNAVLAPDGAGGLTSSAPEVGAVTRSGTLVDGRPYQAFPVTLTVTDPAAVSAIQIFASVDENTAYGVDNLRFDFPPAAPQTFQLPTDLGPDHSMTVDQNANDGSGMLETGPATDVYEFELTNPASMRIAVSAGDGETASWRLRNTADDTVVAGGDGAPSTRTSMLPAGSYSLEVANLPGHAAGDYTLDVALAPTPQTFQLSTPSTIAGPRADGAGQLEGGDSSDVYQFDVAAGTDSVVLDLADSATESPDITWQVRRQSSGALAASGVGLTGKVTVDGLTAGTYELVVQPRDQIAGSYGFRLLTPTQSDFTTAVPTTVTPGVPGAGAGDLSSTADTDTFTFTMPPAGPLGLTWGDPQDGQVPPSWALVSAADGTFVTNGRGGIAAQFTDLVPGGQYRLEVFSEEQRSQGDYSFTLAQVFPEPDIFSITLPATIQDGQPGPGAGNLEGGLAQDVYTFSVPAGPATRLMLDWSQSPGGSGLIDTKLVNAATGAEVLTTGDTNDRMSAPLTAGTYELRMTVSGQLPANTGAYALNVGLAPVPQEFSIGVPATVTPGAIGAGSGALDAAGDIDNYSFTLPGGSALPVQLTWSSPANQVPTAWELHDVTTGAVVDSGTGTQPHQTPALQPGVYKLTVRADSLSGVGNYAFTLRLQQALEAPAFDIAASGSSINTTVTSAAPPNVTYTWNWGDGSSEQAGSTADHSYAAGGTYPVTLTATDPNGRRGQAVRVATVTAPDLATDSFNRTTSNGFGTADRGGIWTADAGPSRQATAAGTATMQMTATTQTTGSYLGQVSSTALDLTVDMALSALPTGSGTYAYIGLRRVQGQGDYRVRVRVTSTGGVTVGFTRVNPDGTWTNVGPETTVTGTTLAPGQTLHVRAQVQPDPATSSTTIRGRVWTGTTEPSTWPLNISDSTAGLQVAGSPGLTVYRPATATVNLTTSFKNFRVVPLAPTPVSNRAPVPIADLSINPVIPPGNGVATLEAVATRSLDAEGAVSYYAWNWGDGTTAPGASAQHTYASAGTYPVILTVTDSAGVSRSITYTVLIANRPLVADDFERSTSNGLGAAPIGGTWTTTGGSSSRFSVSDGAGHSDLLAGQTNSAFLNGVTATDATLQFTLGLSSPPTGAGVYWSTVVRRVASQQQYQARAIIRANGTVAVSISRVNGATETQLGNALVVPNLVLGTDDQLNVEVEVSGTSPTTVSLTAWASGTARPSSPAITRTDSTSNLQAPGSVGLLGYLSGSATTPVTVNIEGFAVHTTR